MQPSPRSGFSLVELSIVIGIIGLLIGGIIVGRSMIRAAELNKVGITLQQYDAAVQNFRQRYGAWPGDMTNATRIWGAQNAIPATCITLPSSGAATCDGNGDQTIASSAATIAEQFRAWQHLANAGLITGSYTGVGGSGGSSHHVGNQNTPAGSFGKTAFCMRYIGSANLFFNTYNILVWGLETSTSIPNAAVLIPEDAASIDSKIDDGKPGTGILSQYNSTSRPNCASTDVSATAAYVLSYRSPSCVLIYRLANQISG
jgi:prepilin-type N-terminal cleavage/methylation domain-containing protein